VTPEKQLEKPLIDPLIFVVLNNTKEDNSCRIE